MRRIAIVVGVLFTVLLAAGCRQAEPPPAASEGVFIDLEVRPQPPVTGDSTLVITVTGADDAPVTDATVSARGDMSHAGMAPVIADGSGGEDGIYVIPFEWTMAGDWFVDVTVTMADGAEYQQRFDLSVDGDMAMDMSAETTPAAMDMSSMAMTEEPMDMSAPMSMTDEATEATDG